MSLCREHLRSQKLRAATQYNVSYSTLRDWITGRVRHGAKSGPASYLSTREEDQLAEFLITSSKARYGKSRKQVMGIAHKVANEKGVLKSGKMSEGWWRRFKERNPHMILRTGDPMASVHFECTTKEVMDSYYEHLDKILEENDLKDKPGQIYNVDESGMPLDAKPPNQTRH